LEEALLFQVSVIAEGSRNRFILVFLQMKISLVKVL
jgi:hypothetical protein